MGARALIPSFAALTLVLRGCRVRQLLAACGSEGDDHSDDEEARAHHDRRRPDRPRLGPIKLVSETGVTPVQLHRAETLLAKTIVGLKRFASPAQAYAAGYRTIGDSITGDEHYVNWSYSNDGHILDPARPESIVYEWRNGKQTAVAAMYALPLGSSFADVPDVGGSLTQWHVHRDLCLTDGAAAAVRVGAHDARAAGVPPVPARPATPPCCTCGTSRLPAVRSAALEGVGAGQVPAGQTRNCDTTNASVP